MGYHSRIISEGRRVNDGMGAFVGECTVKKLIEADKLVRRAKVAVMGITFKENCPDVRNSKVMDIIKRLREYGIEPLVFDPCAEAAEVERGYGLKLSSINELHDMDCLIFAVAHGEYRAMSIDEIKRFYFSGTKPVLIDVKGIFNRKEAEHAGFAYWAM